MNALILLLACTPDFDEARGELASFRILGAGTRDDALAVATWSGMGPWHARAPTVAWSVNGEAVTAAPDAAFTAMATVSDGTTTERAVLSVADDATTLRIDAATRTPREDGGYDLAVTCEGATRVTWSIEGGTLVPTSATSATWTPADDTADIVTAFALALDGRGGTAWTWFDLPVGDIGPAVTVGSRVLRTDATAAGDGPWRATLEEDPDEGYRLAGLTPAEDVAGDLTCATPGGALDAEALVDGRCGRDELLGAEVVVGGAAW